MKSMTDLLEEEYKRLNKLGVVYFSKPYGCCHDEAMLYFKGWSYDPDRITITRQPRSTHITCKPRKGLGLRKTYDIQLWVPL